MAWSTLDRACTNIQDCNAGISMKNALFRGRWPGDAISGGVCVLLDSFLPYTIDIARPPLKKVHGMTEARSLPRTIVYVDGFNLYFGLREAKLQKCMWLNIHELSRHLCGANRRLVNTKYFTSRVSGAPKGASPATIKSAEAKRKRQTEFLEVLATIPDLEITYGHFLAKDAGCHDCGAVWTKFEEKMTDVNIATAMMTDAFQDKFDAAILVSADSDLVPPVRAILKLFPEKRVYVAFPPERKSTELKNLASEKIEIFKTSQINSQLPNQVTLPSGRIVVRPADWS